MADRSTNKPFKISVPDSDLTRLKELLALTRFPDEINDAGWDYGVPLADMKRLVGVWKDGYDWRKHEAALNDALPQFTIDVPVDGFETLNIHYIHKTSLVEGAIPLLFVHGWPGSFFEVFKIISLLSAASSDGPSFHVVTYSLPGYGFSQGPSKKGFGIDQYAEVGHKIMLALGYEQYVAQGGDWGAIIARRLAELYGGTHVKAIHSNMIPVGPPSAFRHPFIFLSMILGWFTDREKAQLQRMQEHQKTGQGYYFMQGTKPQTLGYSLADSPAGLLAWVYEKLVIWTDNYQWTNDEILTWISIYWFSRAGPAATTRIYYEFQRSGLDKKLSLPFERKSVKLGYSWFPKEILASPPSWARTMGDVVFEGTHDHGGHFAAFETPEVLVGDLRKMFGPGGGAHGVVARL